jgi:inner membrane protein
MDSLTQIALGAAIGVAVMGRRTAAWKAALWGGVAGLLPDLDVLWDHGDPVLNMVLHRAETHALFWLACASGPLAWWVARINGEPALWRRWWLAMALALMTHPVLDWFTIYGTQLFLPFTDEALGLGSLFIIDPLYSLPLMAGVVWAVRGSSLGWRANNVGLAWSCVYIAWSVLAQQHVMVHAQASLRSAGLSTEQVFVTPAPFNTVLWRVVAVDGDHLHEGFYSLMDQGRAVRFDAFERGTALMEAQAHHPQLQRLLRFADGFVSLRQDPDGHLWMSDWRMGQYPNFVFTFNIGPSLATGQTPPVATQERRTMDVAAGLAWVWRRLWGEDIAPPR